MNTATNFVKNAVLKYGERYIDTGRFRPVVHVMWIIGKRLATPFSDLVRGGIETNWNDALLSSSFFFYSSLLQRGNGLCVRGLSPPQAGEAAHTGK